MLKTTSVKNKNMYENPSALDKIVPFEKQETPDLSGLRLDTDTILASNLILDSIKKQLKQAGENNAITAEACKVDQEALDTVWNG